MLVVCACGGSGTRMAPATKFINKHLLPIGKGELMVDMPLKFLAAHSFKEIAVVTGTHHASQICHYIGDGEQYGFDRVDYFVQPAPAGIADVLNRVSHKDSQDGVLLILGDNYFELMQDSILSLSDYPNYAYVWEYDIGSLIEAKRFGQIEKDGNPRVVEKPRYPSHSRILTGLYYFPADVFTYVKELTPSTRGELEITDLLKLYDDKNRLAIHEVDGQWFDLGEDDTWMRFVSSRK